MKPSTDLDRRIPITAFVVGLNDAHQLEECLRSVDFCSQVLYVDLGSSDSSRQIAGQFATEIVASTRKPVVEMIRLDFVSLARHDWVLFLDPDERVTQELAAELAQLIGSNQLGAERVGAVRAPWVFYVGRRKLQGTVWGYDNAKTFVINTQRCTLQTTVHDGFRVSEGFAVLDLGTMPGSQISHHWFQGISPFFEKHKRYLRSEGNARLAKGDRTSLFRLVAVGPYAFFDSFLRKRGYRDGLIGIFLSLVWGWYKSSSERELYICQKQSDNRQYLKRLWQRRTVEK